MFSKFFSAATVALAASTMVSAQTFTTCDPTKKDCPADPALGKSVSIDFTKGNDDSVFRKLDGTAVKFEDGGALFAINKETDAPTMASKKYIFFGKIDVVLKASLGQGVVTSVVLQSDDLDEIDWEWVGGDNEQVQTNYFGKGDTSTYDRGAYHAVSNPLNDYHTYTIDWTQDSVKWIIDGALVRELKYADAKGGAMFPQTPMEVKIGTWVAGRKDAPKGTVEWAGGYTDFTKGPYSAYYKSITITDYQGNKGVKGAKEYVYGDRSGSWESIVVKTEGGSDDSSSSASKTATKTESKTTMSTVTASGSASATASSDASATEDAASTATGSSSGSGSGSSGASSAGTSAGASSTPSTVAASSGFMNKASLALGAAGLFFTFLL
ncbi:concanavalin A-like lectin/glucanase domain-containing protein [Colletotrichum phormii]|uniref:Crh-like protein n=1 Tax=Colletotrichum phormii TaxID=359342 RepID=A0AAI9ZU74_9PEZI|nr:concanavalin A-like lectin/glucanase domain-containing protein [Colletotrichum phormii]KAK1637038.1 concanavalin A-like lectin/glucanase domain-containing protein [Colletotrichum phormii]